MTATGSSEVAGSLVAVGFGGGARFSDVNPKALGFEPNLCAPNPGDGGGFENGSEGGNPGDIGGRGKPSGESPGDGGGLDSDKGASFGDGGRADIVNPPRPGEDGGFASEKLPKPGDGGGFNTVKPPPSPGDGGGLEIEKEGGGVESVDLGTSKESMLKRPNFPGSASSSFSDHEKLDGADDGPGEIGSPRLGVELPRARFGLFSRLVPSEAGPSAGSGAVRGSFGATSMLSADMVAL